MKKTVLMIVGAVVLMITGSLYAASGDLVVNGDLTVSGIVNGRAGLINVQVLTTGTTYTPTPGTHKIVVELVGGGGGGGGVVATSGSGGFACAGGGGSGAYARRLFTGISGNYSYSIGGGGTGGGAGGTGGTGGNTTFTGPGGVTVTAGGGSGGGYTGLSSNLVAVAGGVGGAASNGTINITGTRGDYCFNVIAGQSGTSISSGAGGSGYMGQNAAAYTFMSATVSSYHVGTAASGYGGGGQGGLVLGFSQPAGTGGAGAPGLINVWEYN